MTRTKKIIRFLAVILLITGIGVISYPYIRQYLYTIQAKDIIEEYDERMASVDEDDLEWLYQLIVKYNKELFKNRQKDLIDPFSYEQVDFSLKEFGFDEDMIGHIKIPAMDIELPIYLGASEDNLHRGAAHLTQTSIPVGGNNTNAVIAAHRGYSAAAMFRNIDRLKPGNRLTVTNFRETLTYQVTEIRIIMPYDIDEILIQEDRDLLTLISCHPYRHNYQRYVVYCERVS